MNKDAGACQRVQGATGDQAAISVHVRPTQGEKADANQEVPCEASPGRPVAEAGTTMVPMVCVATLEGVKMPYLRKPKKQMLPWRM
jgi:hypothetical protein